MKAIYYFLGIFILIYELRTLLNPSQRIKEMKDLRLILKKDYKLMPENEKKKVAYAVLFVIYSLIYLFLGVFTFQWWLYLDYFLFIILMSVIFNKTREKDKQYYIATVFDAIVGLAFILFTVVNAYHLKIDLF